MSLIATFVGEALIGWLAADFIGGLVHWWQDRVGKPTNRWINRHVLDPNDLHHSDPMDFTKASFWYRNWTTFLAAGIAAAIWLVVAGPSIILLFAFVGGALQNEVHYLTHKPPIGWLRVFQKIGVIQSVRGHSQHHKPPQNANFCILTDWLNPVLEHINFWQGLEKLFRITPRSPQI